MSAEGTEKFLEVNTFAAATPSSVFRQAAVDVVFGQVWTRPGLTRRQRRWVSLTAAATTGTTVGTNAHAYGALNSGDITLSELGELLLQLACHVGWPRAALLDSVISQAVTRIATERGEPALTVDFVPLTTAPVGELADLARTTRAEVLPGAALVEQAGTPLTEMLFDGIEYAQVWTRPQLARGDRRLVALTCFGATAQRRLLHQHVQAALDLGEYDEASLREVALQAGLYCGAAVGIGIDEAITEVMLTR